MVSLCKDGATAHIANYYINVLSEVFEDRLWPTRSCNFYPEEPKSKVHSKSPHIFDEFKHNCKSSISIEVSELKLVSNSLFKRPEVF
jgi:hypothetical protein